MPQPIIEQLLSDELEVLTGGLSTASAIRRVLQRAPQVQAVRAALQQGDLTEDQIIAFVGGLLREFRQGPRFRYDIPLAALAVALEEDPADSAGELLREMAQLAVAARVGSDRHAVIDALGSIDRLGSGTERPRVHFLEMPVLNISSSGVRERVARGEQAVELVGEAVGRYIEEHELYRERATVGR